ncbi:MAG TPA: NAD(+) diphosphatase [Steroidobacteraceae bacterium]|jgi:NAD+ diphosphatase|nr:NAD(+) diphosphatase [Steroidobacteraceae bacterium]
MDPERYRPNHFAGPYLDRRAEMREAADWLAAARADASTLYVISRGTTQLVYTDPEPRIAFVRNDHPLVRAASDAQLVLLGCFRNTRTVLLDLDPREFPEDEPPWLPGAKFVELRPLANTMPAEESGLMAYARALSIWRSRHRFCGVCGSALVPQRAGHVMKCVNCGHESFPRIDPAIIVLVADGDRALLGRQASWPPGRYSTIAGFAEPGESLEDAVVREVFEETNVRVRYANYHSSQPWPFPSSLMVGFHASAAPNQEVRVTGELEDARWFTRDELLNGPPVMPPTQSISYRLITTWLRYPALTRIGEED